MLDSGGLSFKFFCPVSGETESPHFPTSEGLGKNPANSHCRKLRWSFLSGALPPPSASAATRRVMVAYQGNDRGTHWLNRIRLWDGLALIFGGVVVLAGWISGNEFLKRLNPGLIAMNPVTAFGFIIAGASLLCFWRRGEHSVKAEGLGRGLSMVVILIGVLKLGEYIFGWRLLFDQILFRTLLHGNPADFNNQIAPNTALDFVLGGLGLWFLNGSARRFSRSAQNFAIFLGLISLGPLIGYLYQASYLYSVGPFPMALSTAVFFFFLAGGILLAQSEDGVVALFMSATPGGAIARRLVPFAFAIPIALGALQIWGERAGLFPKEFGVTLIVVGSVATFASLTWRTAVLLNRADGQRRQAEENLQKAHDELEARVKERTAELHQSNESLRVQIAELEKAQEKIGEQAELLDKAKDAIVVIDVKGQISFWSKGAEALYGWNPGEAVGKNIRELLFKNEEWSAATFEKVFNEGAWNGETEHVAKGGKRVCVESRWTLVNDDQGRARCVMLIDSDITEKKQYEAEVLRSQRMDSIGALAGGIAHDLNNALAPVVMCAEVLKGELATDEREKFLEILTSSAQRAIQMVKQILSFARGSRGKGAPVPVASWVRETAKIVQDTFPKSISICVKIQTKETWKIQGDVTELHQVLLNLCVNARDAMPNGGRLTLSVENARLEGKNVRANGAAGHYVLVAVSDSGTGIPPEVLPRIFEPFFTTKSPDKGTGLGLSTVASIVKNRGGFLEVKTECGKGTEFQIYLPAIETTAEAESKPDEAAPPKGRGELILVMDDEDAVRELMKTTLEGYGYRVVTALNGLHGIARFEELKNEIRLIVTDSDMPYMDGLSAICSMQQLRPDVPAIIASGAKHDPKQLERMNPRNIANLGKPFSVKELLASVARLIGTH
jgi:two-component system, cell cycle sensor histidine kinase and response regulator CckA